MKKKLTILEQLEDIRLKGITFNYISEKEACSFLK